MADNSETSRREFLGKSARAATLAGLAAGGCSETTVQVASSPRAAPIPAPQGPTPAMVKPDKKIRIGWIGVGGRSSALLGPVLDRKDVEIVAVAEINPANRDTAAKRIKDKHGNSPEFYSGPGDYNKLLAREDVDAVFSALPCDMHGPIYLECFRHGKHFYGEKPLAIQAAQADALVAAQKLNPGLIAQIGFQRRASERYKNGIRMIHEGVVGEPIDGRAAWNNGWGPIGLPSEGGRVWLGRRERSGDWMLEQACHTWDVLCWVAGALPEAASGEGRQDIFKDLDADRNVTDFYFALLRFPKNFLVDFQHSWFTPHKEGGRWSGVFERIAGKKGGIALDEGKVFPREDKGEVKDIPGDENPRSIHDLHTFKSVNAFFECVRSGQKPPSGVENGRAATLTGLLVRKAVYERRWVSMSEITGTTV